MNCGLQRNPSPKDENNMVSTTSSSSANSANDSTSTSIRSSRSCWWEKSVVRRSLAKTTTLLEHTVERSTFLQTQPALPTAIFRRSEIVTDKILGVGGFSMVLAITGWNLDPELSAQCSEPQQALRLKIAQETPNRYALKHLKHNLVYSQDEFSNAAADLATEAAYMVRLQHANILSVRGLPADGLNAYRSGEYDGYFIIVDRLLEGTLEDRIQNWRRHNVSVQRKTQYAHSAAKALEYLHSHHILFRDLKPANMGIACDGSLKLFDFGLCRDVADCQELYCMSGVGTRRYQAPESVLGCPYSAKVDVYSWAIVTWELLTHEKPYADYGFVQHRELVCEQGERPNLVREWPGWLRDVLEQSWSASISKRLSMAEVVYQLEEGLEQRQKLLESPVSVLDSLHVSAPPLPSVSLARRSKSLTMEKLELPLQELTLNVDDEGLEVYVDSVHLFPPPLTLPPRCSGVSH